MRNQVQPFPVDVHDIYDEARASMALTRRRRWPTVWLTTAAAVALGAAVGWLLASPSTAPSPAPSVVVPTVGATVETMSARQGAPVARSLDAPAADGWPIILHRAGDGRFYADLILDGHLFNIEANPRLEASRLTPATLPPGALPLADAWEADAVVLEHRRLPATRFAVTAAPDATAAIGADLLARHFVVEEQPDRLRLVPRATRP